MMGFFKKAKTDLDLMFGRLMDDISYQLIIFQY